MIIDRHGLAGTGWQVIAEVADGGRPALLEAGGLCAFRPDRLVVEVEAGGRLLSLARVNFVGTDSSLLVHLPYFGASRAADGEGAAALDGGDRAARQAAAAAQGTAG